MVRVTKLELHRTITDIMKKGDLDQLTTKKIRLLCEQKYNVDLSSRKQEIDNIVMSFINKHCRNEKKVNADNADDGSESSSDESDSSHSDHQNSESSCSESECSYSSDGESKTKKSVAATSAQKSKNPTKPTNVPAKKTVTASKKTKKAVDLQDKKQAAGASAQKRRDSPTKRATSELDDAAYARQLQAEEWNFRQRTVKKLFRNVPKKKNDTEEKSKKKKASPFMKKCLLSPALAEVLGTNELSRPDVVQKMWAVIRERNIFVRRSEY